MNWTFEVLVCVIIFDPLSKIMVELGQRIESRRFETRGPWIVSKDLFTQFQDNNEHGGMVR